MGSWNCRRLARGLGAGKSYLLGKAPIKHRNKFLRNILQIKDCPLSQVALRLSKDKDLGELYDCPETLLSIKEVGDAVVSKEPCSKLSNVSAFDVNSFCLIFLFCRSLLVVWDPWNSPPRYRLEELDVAHNRRTDLRCVGWFDFSSWSTESRTSRPAAIGLGHVWRYLVSLGNGDNSRTSVPRDSVCHTLSALASK